MAAPSPCSSSSRESRRHIPRFPKFPRKKVQIPGSASVPVGFFRPAAQTLAGRVGIAAGNSHFFPWILVGIDFGTFGSFQTLQFPRDKNPPRFFLIPPILGLPDVPRDSKAKLFWEFFFFFPFGEGWLGCLVWFFFPFPFLLLF